MSRVARRIYVRTATNPVDALYEEIGDRIRKEREELGFTQSDLAQEIGMLRTSIANIETGRQRLPIHVLFNIARALGVTPKRLLPDGMAESEAI